MKVYLTGTWTSLGVWRGGSIWPADITARPGAGSGPGCCRPMQEVGRNLLSPRYHVRSPVRLAGHQGSEIAADLWGRQEVRNQRPGLAAQAEADAASVLRMLRVD
eukprot:CAMPEP_0175614330 /NCGR_PEP_ID=MMETSP0096-20121207/64796_1 /TAXON_ID=311494 /ORGANISM="Alexandrium monilatum, Strain CCMP3105" /LENGTH=104 /DNA_ID=CAMNT_0016919429 /DNA_START=282 /DNA_END=593 /DNA_ORIENTATION=+